jgi:ankyrin repeat protein
MEPASFLNGPYYKLETSYHKPGLHTFLECIQKLVKHLEEKSGCFSRKNILHEICECAGKQEKAGIAINALFQHGADIEATNQYGETGLYLASFYGNYQAAVALLANGANPQAMSNSKQNPLQAALIMGCTQIARLLIDHGATLNHMSQYKLKELYVEKLIIHNFECAEIVGEYLKK